MSFMGDEKACGEVEVEEVTEWYDCSGEEEVEELTDWYDVTVPFSTTDRSAVFAVTFAGIPGNPALSFSRLQFQKAVWLVVFFGCIFQRML